MMSECVVCHTETMREAGAKDRKRCQHLLARRARMVDAARRMKAACSAAFSLLLVSSMCTSSGTKPWRTINRLRGGAAVG